MKSTGIIVEYNPFHNGHLHHLMETKKINKNNVIIAVMSGNFTQRGDVSVIDKWDKTNIALDYGVDIVVELPFHYATQSADIFAKGSIEILKELKIDNIVFGSECNDVESLIKNAKTILKNRNNNIKELLKEGMSYPKSFFNSLNIDINTPNDILGILYIKEIIRQKTNIKPLTIKRTNDYHDAKLEEISSATSIRMALKEKKDISNSVPIKAIKYLSNVRFIEEYYEYLKYKIITTDNLSIYQGVDEGLENRIKKYIYTSNTLEELIMNIKTKRYTYNKIKRMLLHILVGFTKEEALKYKDINYIRILGMTQKGKKYINKIKKDITIPLISNFNKYKDLLNLDYKSSLVYYLNSKSNNYNELIKKEFNRIIIK